MFFFKSVTDNNQGDQYLEPIYNLKILILVSWTCRRDNKNFLIVKPIVIQFSGLSVRCMNWTADWTLLTGTNRVNHMNGSNAGWMHIGRSLYLIYFIRYDNLVSGHMFRPRPDTVSLPLPVLTVLVLIERKLHSVTTFTKSRKLPVEPLVIFATSMYGSVILYCN